MTTHTPGPWRVYPVIGTHIGTEGDPYGHGPMHIADVRGWGHLTGRGGGCAFDEDTAVAIQTANARLIAAAPELLVALLDLLRVIATDDLIPESVSYMQQARAALAKAEGR